MPELGKGYHTPIVNAYSETVAVRSLSSHVDVRKPCIISNLF